MGKVHEVLRDEMSSKLSSETWIRIKWGSRLG